jgi:SPP1 family predicted phage head-tail adaptor
MAAKQQQYNDGILKVYEVGNIAQPGNMRKEGLTLKLANPLRYEELKVFDSKFWAASQEGTKIERLLRIPRTEDVIRDDKIIPIDGKQYKIVQIQYPVDVVPKSMDLSLERLEVAYEVG